MSDQRTPSEDELIRIMDAVADSALKETDAEILEEIRQQGQNPKQAAEQVRTILRQAVKSHRQRKLAEAKEQHQLAVAAMKEKVYSLPKTAKERLQLLSATFQIRPELQSLLTAQHRELKSLTDDDIVSYLQQLQELGVLPPHEESEE